MKYLIAGLLGFQFAIDITYFYMVAKIGQHERLLHPKSAQSKSNNGERK